MSHSDQPNNANPIDDHPYTVAELTIGEQDPPCYVCGEPRARHLS